MCEGFCGDALLRLLGPTIGETVSNRMSVGAESTSRWSPAKCPLGWFPATARSTAATPWPGQGSHTSWPRPWGSIVPCSQEEGSRLVKTDVFVHVKWCTHEGFLWLHNSKIKFLFYFFFSISNTPTKSYQLLIQKYYWTLSFAIGHNSCQVLDNVKEKFSKKTRQVRRWVKYLYSSISLYKWNFSSL